MVTDVSAFKHTRFKPGDRVSTEFGIGFVKGMEFPDSLILRWVIEVDASKALKRNFLIENGKPLCFFDREVVPASGLSI